jgi:pyridoxine 5-phosphate synthase
MSFIRLGVNVDHVATLRQARRSPYPDPVEAALLAADAGADSITIHLREDRRHIQDHDVYRLLERSRLPTNFEMAVTEEMVNIACQSKPAFACLVPEKREEVTTEGGLDVAGQFERVYAACQRLQAAGVVPALFIDADPRQLEATLKAGVPHIEIHTGHYAELVLAGDEAGIQAELNRIQAFAKAATAAGLEVHAGHGLTVANVPRLVEVKEIVELNIGHALIADAVFVGLPAAIAAFRRAMRR